MAWVHELTRSRLDHVSAALRHLDDSDALCSTSPMQAAYLAGYGPECARKACLTGLRPTDLGEIDKAIGHGVGGDAELALSYALDIDPLAARYELRAWNSSHPRLAQWKPDWRYARSNRLGRSAARRTVDEAAQLVVEQLAALWADGRISSLTALAEVSP